VVITNFGEIAAEVAGEAVRQGGLEGRTCVDVGVVLRPALIFHRLLEESAEETVHSLEVVQESSVSGAVTDRYSRWGSRQQGSDGVRRSAVVLVQGGRRDADVIAMLTGGTPFLLWLHLGPPLARVVGL
jgi:nucleotide-binding universal stress UspA family protein